MTLSVMNASVLRALRFKRVIMDINRRHRLMEKLAGSKRRVLEAALRQLTNTSPESERIIRTGVLPGGKQDESLLMRNQKLTNILLGKEPKTYGIERGQRAQAVDNIKDDLKILKQMDGAHRLKLRRLKRKLKTKGLP